MISNIGKKIPIKYIVISALLAIMFGITGVTMASISKTLVVKSNNVAMSSVNHGVTVDNTTYTYPIQYVVGDVRREINIRTGSSTASIVRVKIEYHYVDLSYGSSYDFANKLPLDSYPTDNVNIIGKMSNWYYDTTTGYAYYLGKLGGTNATNVRLMSGVEFFVNSKPASLYTNKGLVISTKAESKTAQSTVTSASSWDDAPTEWVDYMNATPKAEWSTTLDQTNGVQTINLNNNVSYDVNTIRAPIYLQNIYNTECALRFVIGIQWSENSLYINNIKFKFGNSADFTSTAVTGSSSSGGQTSLTENAASYEFFYNKKLKPFEMISVLESIEMINNAYGKDYADKTLSLTVQAFVIKYDAAKTLQQYTSNGWNNATDAWLSKVKTDISVPSSTPYTVHSYVINKPILFDTTVAANDRYVVDAPSVLVNNSTTKSYSVTVEYSYEWMIWCDMNNVLKGKYLYWEATEASIVNDTNQWSYSESTKKFTNAHIEPGNSVQLYEQLRINAPVGSSFGPVPKAELVAKSNIYSYAENGTKISEKYNDEVLNYTPKQYLNMTMSITVTETTGALNTAFNAEVYNTTTTSPIPSAPIGTYYFGIGVKNVTNEYRSAIVTLSTITDNGTVLPLISGWSNVGAVYTSSIMAPGETIQFIHGFSTSSASTNIRFSTSVKLNLKTAVDGGLYDIYNSTSFGGGAYRTGGTVDMDMNVTSRDAAGKYLRVKVTQSWLSSTAIPTIAIQYSTDDWILSADGYMYLKRVLVPGDTVNVSDGYTVTNGSTGTAYQFSKILFELTVEMSDTLWNDTNNVWNGYINAIISSNPTIV